MWSLMTTTMIFFAAVILLLTGEIIYAEDTVRIVNGGGPYDGIVEVLVSSNTLHYYEWARICDTSWSMSEADVVCTQFGHPGAMWAVSPHGHDDVGFEGPWMVDVQCNGDESTIQDCDYTLTYEKCSYENAKITCNYAAYLGCFVNNFDNPLLEHELKSPIKMTIEYCLDSCRDSDYKYAGVQEAELCFCDVDFDSDNNATLNEECNSNCVGNESQACGGKSDVFYCKFIGVYPTSMGGCGGVAEQSRGTVYSPGFPGKHIGGEDQKCQWDIYGPGGTVLESEFIMFDIGDQYTITIIDEASNSQQEFRRGTDLEIKHTTTNEMAVKFLYEADGINLKKTAIFALEWKAVWLCYDNHTIENGIISPMDGYTYMPGDKLVLECDVGYYPSTNITSVTCKEDGTWDDTLSDCIVVSCGDPGKPDQGGRIGDDFTYESQVQYSCSEGYTLNGTDTIVCQANGEWSDDPPTCIIVSCGDPGEPDQGGRIGDDYTYESEVKYSCSEGYTLNGTDTIVCQANGEWSDDPPTCIKNSKALYIAVVGGVLGILILIGFIVAMVMLFRRLKYQKSKRHQTPSDNAYSASTDDDRPWHEYETVPKSQPLNNTKNNRTTAKNTLVTTNPAFDGELTQSAAQKDMLDGNVHRGGSDNATGHVYNYIDCSKVDPQSGFVVNDLYRPCSFVTDSAAVTPSSKYQWQRDVRKPKDVTSFDSKTQAVGEGGVGFKDNDIYEGGDEDGNTKDHNEYADLQGDTSGFVDNVLYEHGDEAPSGSERRQHVYDTSGDDKADGNGDGVYYSTIGHGDTAGVLNDNISYEPATFQQS